MQKQCISDINKLAGAILAFPLSVVTWAASFLGFDSLDFFNSEPFIYYLINSFVVAVLIWHMLYGLFFMLKSTSE